MKTFNEELILKHKLVLNEESNSKLILQENSRDVDNAIAAFAANKNLNSKQQKIIDDLTPIAKQYLQDPDMEIEPYDGNESTDKSVAKLAEILKSKGDTELEEFGKGDTQEKDAEQPASSKEETASDKKVLNLLLDSKYKSYNDLIDAADAGELVKDFDSIQKGITNKEIRNIIIDHFVENNDELKIDGGIKSIAAGERGQERLYDIFDTRSLGCEKKDNPFIPYFKEMKLQNLFDRTVYDLANLYADKIISYNDLTNKTSLPIIHDHQLFSKNGDHVYDLVKDYTRYAVAAQKLADNPNGWDAWTRPNKNESLNESSAEDGTEVPSIYTYFYDTSKEMRSYQDIQRELGELKQDSSNITGEKINDEVKNPDKEELNIEVNKEYLDKNGRLDWDKLRNLTEKERNDVIRYTNG